MFLIVLFALLCTAPLSLVKWHLTNDYDDGDGDSRIEWYLLGMLWCDWQVVLSVLATTANIHREDGKCAPTTSYVVAGTVQRRAEIRRRATENTQGGNELAVHV